MPEAPLGPRGAARAPRATRARRRRDPAAAGARQHLVAELGGVVVEGALGDEHEHLAERGIRAGVGDAPAEHLAQRHPLAADQEPLGEGVGVEHPARRHVVVGLVAGLEVPRRRRRATAAAGCRPPPATVSTGGSAHGVRGSMTSSAPRLARQTSSAVPPSGSGWACGSRAVVGEAARPRDAPRREVAAHRQPSARGRRPRRTTSGTPAAAPPTMRPRPRASGCSPKPTSATPRRDGRAEVDGAEEAGPRGPPTSVDRPGPAARRRRSTPPR